MMSLQYPDRCDSCGGAKLTWERLCRSCRTHQGGSPASSAEERWICAWCGRLLLGGRQRRCEDCRNLELNFPPYLSPAAECDSRTPEERRKAVEHYAKRAALGLPLFE